jgi:hypothetical protein
MDVDLLKNIAEDVKNFEINMNSFFSYSSDWAIGHLVHLALCRQSRALFSRPSTYETPIVPSLNYDLLMQVIIG